MATRTRDSLMDELKWAPAADPLQARTLSELDVEIQRSDAFTEDEIEKLKAKVDKMIREGKTCHSNQQ